MAMAIYTTDEIPDPVVYDGAFHGTLQTTDGTTTTIVTIPTVTDQAYKIKVGFVARRSDVAGDIYVAEYVAAIKNVGGTVSQVGTLTVLGGILASVGVLAVGSIDVSGVNILLQVTGEALKTYEWKCSGLYDRI